MQVYSAAIAACIGFIGFMNRTCTVASDVYYFLDWTPFCATVLYVISPAGMVPPFLTDGYHAYAAMPDSCRAMATAGSELASDAVSCCKVMDCLLACKLVACP